MTICFVLSQMEIKLPAGQQSGDLAFQKAERFLITISLGLDGWARTPLPVVVDLTALVVQERFASWKYGLSSLSCPHILSDRSFK